MTTTHTHFGHWFSHCCDWYMAYFGFDFDLEYDYISLDGSNEVVMM